MSSAYRFHSNPQLFPRHFIQQKEEQLKHLLCQFFSLDLPISKGFHILLRWSYALMPSPKTTSHEYFKVQLIHLSTGEIVTRLWEAKGNCLVSDSRCDPNQITSAVVDVYPTEWWQSLADEVLSEDANKSLAPLLKHFRHKIGPNGQFNIIRGFCRPSLGKNKEDIWLEYKLHVSPGPSNKTIAIKGRVQLKEENQEPTHQSKDVQKEWVSEIVDTPTPTYEGLRELTNDVKENIVLYAREELARTEFLNSWKEWIVDCYNFVYMKREISGVIKSGIDILIRSQYAHVLIIYVTVEYDGINYKIVSAKKPIMLTQKLDKLIQDGTHFDNWQRFFHKDSSVEAPYLDDLVQVGMQKMDTNYELIKIANILCRVKRNQEGHFDGFEYRVFIKLRTKKEEVYHQWFITGHLNDFSTLKFISLLRLKEEEIIKVETLGPTINPLNGLLQQINDRQFTQVINASKLEPIKVNPSAKSSTVNFNKPNSRSTNVRSNLIKHKELPVDKGKIGKRLSDLLGMTFAPMRLPKIQAPAVRRSSNQSYDFGRPHYTRNSIQENFLNLDVSMIN